MHVSSDQPFGASVAELAAERVTVTVSGRPVRAVRVDERTLAVRVPAGSPGAPAFVVVVVRAGLAGVPAPVRYAAVVTAVGPSAGPVAGGKTVRVTGRGLSDGTA